MATTTSLRSRRSEVQLHALAGVEREIQLNDNSARRKYLRDYSQAFRFYECVVTSEELKRDVCAAGTVLIGDYHALPAAQRFAARLLEERCQPGDRPVVLALETIFARDQHILEEWWRREIEEAELRQRIRYDLDWGYDWAPFYELLVTAREHAEAIYGLDCMPREDLRKIGARDRHAAHKIAEIRQRHPNAAILVLFGESHLAPGHLPRQLHERLPEETVLTILQNVDALYWRAAGEQREQVRAVRVNDNVLCVFNSTPLEKYEHYRLHLSRWGRSEEEGPDLAPTIYNLIQSLLRFLEIKLYSPKNGTQPKFLVDMLPEVCSGAAGRLRRLLARESLSEEQQQTWVQDVEERGSAYLARANAFYVHEFNMMYAAEEAARFLHQACRNLPAQRDSAKPDGANLFWISVLEHALAYFGSRVIYPARPAVRELGELSSDVCREIMQTALRLGGAELEWSARQLGYRIGSDLYDAYLAGAIVPRRLRRFFLARLHEPGAAHKLCLELIAKNPPRKRPAGVKLTKTEGKQQRA